MTTTRRMGLAALAGAAAGLGHAPFGFWPVALLGFAWLIWLVSRADRPGRIGWAGGTGYFAITLHWIVEPFLVDVARHGWMAPFALILLSAGLALFWGAAGWLSARFTTQRALAFALLLGLAELARGHVLTGFPWAMPAYIWADTPVLGMAATIGPYGLTAATLVLLALPSAARRLWTGGVLAAAILLAFAVFGYQLPLKQDHLGVARLVQPNAPQHEKWDPEKAHVFVDRAIEFTAAPKGGVDLIVWPETAVPYVLDLAAPVLSRIATAADGVPVVTGINRRNDAGNWFNTMVTVNEAGQVSDTYDKVHLVPFGEYIPFRLGILQAMAGITGFGFSAGDAVRLVDTPLGRALPLICYEAIFPGHARSVAERPDYILQITNDAWFGTFSGPYQHLDQARFRAVEQGLPLIRAANTGISAVIDRNGRVLADLALGEAGYLDVLVPAGTVNPTFYARWGDLPVTGILLITLCALFFLKKRNTPAMERRST